MIFKITVHGKVQGVGFRYFTKMKAEALKLNGTVQNLDTGQVEIYVAGNEEAVFEFINWCHHGPETAKVESIDFLQILIEKEYTSFTIIR